MANNTFIKTPLELRSPICMDINDSVVRPFDSFNKKNAPFVGDQLSPFYVYDEKITGSESGNVVYSQNGDRYSIVNRYLMKNGKRIEGNELSHSYSLREERKQTIYYDGSIYDTTKSFIEVYRVLEKNPVTNEEKFAYYCEWRLEGVLSKFKIRSLNKNSDMAYLTYLENNFYFISMEYDSSNLINIYADRFTIVSGNWQLQQIKEISVNLDKSVTVLNPFISINKLPSKTENFYGFSIINQSGAKIINDIVPVNFIITKIKPDTKPFTMIDKIRIGTADKYYEFPFFFGTERPSFESSERNPFFFYCGKYDDIKGSAGVESENVFFSGAHAITGYTQGEDGYIYITPSWRTWYKDDTIKNNTKNIRNMVANSYTIYEDYYQQIACVKRKEQDNDIFIPMTFTDKAGLEGSIFTGANIDSVEISPATLVYNDLPDVINLEYFHVNINNGYISGVASKNNNLVAPWFLGDIFRAIPDVNHPDERIFLHDENNGQFVIEKNISFTNDVLTIYNDRYILIKSDSKYNAYDILKDEWFNWTNGYNGNAIIFNGISSSITQEELIAYGKKANSVTSFAIAVNANYEVSGNPFVSSIFPAVRLIGVLDAETKFAPTYIFAPYTGVDIADIYTAKAINSLVPIYKYSYKKTDITTTIIKTNLVGLVYPESPNTILSLSLQAKFIKSYNNHDFIIEKGKSYPIIYSNNYPVFAYRALTFIENIQNVFVIQNSNYLIFDNKIMSVAFQGDQIIANAIVCDITGMTFIGSTNQVAFFFSKLAKKIYAFTGDTILQEQRGANVIDEVYGTFFIPADNTIVMSCREYDNKDYVYFFGNDSFLKIEQQHVESCFFADDSVILVDDTKKTRRYSYFKRPDFKKLSIELQTGFFGVGNEMSSILDCWYIRVFDEDEKPGEITISQNVITNIGVKSESKTILVTPQDWDSISHSYLIRYQPQYQNGVGFQLNIKSNMAIYEVIASYRQGETQLTAPKAQI